MKNKLQSLLTPFTSLKNRRFANLYFAQTISLLGDAFTWVGIALLAFEFAGNQSARILATALTLRVTAFILFGSFAGVVADRFDRKKIMILTHLSRMIVVGMFPFINAEWQIYLLIFLLNIFNAFFIPAYKAAIPQLIRKKEEFANAIVLSNATWQLLGVLGPGLAGAMAVILGARQIFFFDAISFIVAAILILLIPGSLLIRTQPIAKASGLLSFTKDLFSATKLLFHIHPVRFALLIELVTAIAGAHILVNTIGHIKGFFQLTDLHYGWIMAAFGIGATIAAFTINVVDRSKNKTRVLILGAVMIAGSVTLASAVPYAVLIFLWMIAGLGQSYTDIPSQILIAENSELSQQGRLYGAHFAWSHLWWAIGYILAGFTGINFGNNNFMIGGFISLSLLFIVYLFELRFQKNIS